jgi:hypothetical protein
MDIQHGHEALACSLNMKKGHAWWTSSTDKQNGQTEWTSMDMQHRLGTWTYGLDMQHWNMDMQHGHWHAEWTWTCSMGTVMQLGHEHESWTWTCKPTRKRTWTWTTQTQTRTWSQTPGMDIRHGPKWVTALDKICTVTDQVKQNIKKGAKAFVFYLFGNKAVKFEQFDGSTALPFKSHGRFNLGGKVVTCLLDL